MKVPYAWLKEWIDVPWSARELGSRLTMAGFELEALLDGADPVLELNVTPNRGDAMSVLGIAREVAALSGLPVKSPASPKGVAAQINDQLAVLLEAPAACPKFVGRIIRGANNRAAVPAWMQQRLAQAGVRSISPLVDVTNYVLLELGQPMHAYDLVKLKGGIRVRLAQSGEAVKLLDGRTIEGEPDLLLITDEAGAVGAAGIMGGERTSVSEATTDVYLEVAYFAPEAVLGRARRLGMQTDASQRFERGVDPGLQERAIERATELIVSIAGGRPGPTQLTQAAEHLPKRESVPLRRAQLRRLLGVEIPDARIVAVLESLGMTVVPRHPRESGGPVKKVLFLDPRLRGDDGKADDGDPANGDADDATAPDWLVTPPSYRFDIAIEADLIEELARIVGYESIPETDALAPQRFRELPAQRPDERGVLEAMAARGYQEAISLAFVDPALQTRLFPDRASQTLANPIASDLAVMRVSLWPGLLRAALENQHRQQDRVRLFEHGRRFVAGKEIDTLAGIACGRRWPEQWGMGKDNVDFFDVKSDVEALLAGTHAGTEFRFEVGRLGCLHPGRAARVLRGGEETGWLGALHPALVQELGFTYAPVLFELDYATTLEIARPAYSGVSRFPLVRRDLAVIVDEEVTFSALRERVILAAPGLLHHCFVFDVYRGPGIEPGRKSVALGLIFQDISRTLTEKEVDGAVVSIVAELRAGLNAKTRE